MTMTTIPSAGPNAAPDPLAALPGYDADTAVLELDGLRIEIGGPDGRSRVVDGVDCSVTAGETVAIVGESGCGKSITARAIMGILPPGAEVVGGTVRLHGVDLLALDGRRRRRLRGDRVAMVFQDALSALNPVLPIGYQIAEVFRAHRRLSRREAHLRTVEMLDRVRIPAAEQRARDYPHQFSGGMRQRVMIAMALALNPDVLIADEPTTALDVTVQAQIMELLADLQAEHGIGLILITHDMGVVADIADRVVVMYAGRVVEQAPAGDLYTSPAHPYSRALLDAIPGRGTRGRSLAILPGAPPDSANRPTGCALRPRCPLADDACATDPPSHEVARGRSSACHRWTEVIAG
jgi:oligopeptide/dipeptide ABC transporter ATP-binding protein